jgi:hypothetical protein
VLTLFSCPFFDVGVLQVVVRMSFFHSEHVEKASHLVIAPQAELSQNCSIGHLLQWFPALCLVMAALDSSAQTKPCQGVF